jgi:hypothetical protein
VSRLFAGAALVVMLVAPSHAAVPCDGDIPTDASVAGYTIGEVHLDVRWGRRILSDQWPIHPGDAYSRTAIFESMRAAMAALKSATSAEPLNLETRSHTLVNVVTPCVVRHDGDKTIDVRIRTYSTSLSFGDIASNLLPQPASAKATAFSHVPAVIRLLNPSATVRSEEGMGTGVAGRVFVTTNRPRRIDTQAAAAPPPVVVSNTTTSSMLGVLPVAQQARPLQLTAHVNAARWLSDEGFYNMDGGLALSWSAPARGVDRVTVQGNGMSKASPNGAEQRLERRGVQLAGSVALKPGPWFDTLDMGIAYAGDRAAVAEHGAAAETRIDNDGLRAFALADAQIAGGFTRAAVWYDKRSDGTDGSYTKSSILAAYSRELPIIGAPGNHRHTLGLETIVAAGSASSGVPAHALFFGGHSFDDFLYRDAASVLVGEGPRGPLIRSAGPAQLAASDGAGGRSFVSANVSISLPLPRLARPLIPEEEIDPTTLKGLIKVQSLTTSKNFLAEHYMNEGLSGPEADARAEEEVDAIRPAITYIADSANLIALKPVFLFDVATLRPVDGTPSPLRVGVGGGVQLIVVTFKVELGYVHAVRRQPGDRSGNLFLRMAVTDIF